MVGCGNPAVAHIVAEALSSLGVRGLVVTGSDGLDEITIAGSSQLIEVQANHISTKQIVPEDFGMTTVLESDIAGGDATANASEFLAIISGQGRKPLVELVTLNAAFALSLVKPNYSLDSAINTVRTALADGSVETFFEKFRSFVNEPTTADPSVARVSERGQMRPATSEEIERGEAVYLSGPTIPVREGA